MKKSTFFMLFLLWPLLSNGQNAYWNARAMRETMRGGKVPIMGKKSVVVKGLQQHAGEELDGAGLYERYKDNPFMGKYLEPKTINKGEPDRNENDFVFGFSLGGNVGRAGGSGFPLSPSALLAGTADFVVKRSKQELGILLFNDFQEAVAKSEIMQALLPSTAGILGRMDKEIYHFEAYTKTLKEQFVLDLDQLPHHLSTYVRTTPYIKDEDTRVYLEDAFAVSDMMLHAQPPTEMIRYMGRDAALMYHEPKDEKVRQLRTGLQVLAFFSESLEHNDSTRYWISAADFALLGRDSILSDLYMGLLYEESKKVHFRESGLNTKLQSMVGQGEERRQLLNSLRTFVVRGQHFVNLIAPIKNEPVVQASRLKQNDDPDAKPVPQARFLSYYHLSEASFDFIEEGYRLGNMIMNKTQGDSSLYQFLGILRGANQIALDVHSEQYASAMLNTVVLLERVLTQANSLTCQTKELLRYGTFMATLAQAKDAAAVSAAIEAFALPAGSSSIKKYERFSVSVNAYVGIAGGQEYLEGRSASPFYALSTPVGLSLNWGLRKGGSISVFGSIIDIGALTAFRFRDSTANALPDVRFENVFAPGGYLIYGLPKFPLAVGIGAQVGPQLRTITSGGGQATRANGWRIGITLALDIPFVNLFTSSRRARKCQ